MNVSKIDRIIELRKCIERFSRMLACNGNDEWTLDSSDLEVIKEAKRDAEIELKKLEDWLQ
jgi:hypothetical protein